MSDMGAEELSRNILKNELEAAEMTEELSQNYSTEEINDAMESVIQDILDKVEDRDRKGKIFLLTYQIGQSVNSVEMARKGKELYEEWSGGV